MRTRQVATSIQAVSPLSGVGAAGACARAGSHRRPASASPPSSAGEVKRDIIDRTPIYFSGGRGSSEGVGVGLAGADADGALERHDEDLAVADLAGARRGRDAVDDARHELAGDRHLDLDLGQKAHGVFGAAVDLRMPLLPSVTL